ncbi:MAG: endolytic transglycosylase MltG [Pseudomonadota bacterium]|nr:endolytic transglycosylase MltG [Pseudomonadota bacterium]
MPDSKEVVIPKGKSLKQVARILKREGVIDSPAIFELGVRASGNTLKIKSGEYSFPRRCSAKLAMNILTDGQTVARRFIAPEGMTSRQIVELMDKYLGLTGTVSVIPPDGELLPETYNYSYGDTKESLIRRMRDKMDKTVAELWAKRDKKVPLKNPYEAIILASIVEKETARPDERPHIASVFYNRLKKRIRLQSDPTVIYAITNGKLDLKRALTYADLKVQNPYNTYVVYGLPQGPISNPGRAALEAVLNPMETNDVYFVADGRGGHVFSPTYEGHQKNVTQWRQSRKKKKEPKPAESIKPIPELMKGNEKVLEFI